MLVIRAISTKQEGNPAQFHNMLVELGLIAGTVVALAVAILVLRSSAFKFTMPLKSEAD